MLTSSLSACSTKKLRQFAQPVIEARNEYGIGVQPWHEYDYLIPIFLKHFLI